MVVDLAILEVFPVPPLHIAAEGFTFRLGLAHHEGEDHLVIHEEGVHILFLEVNSHAMPFQAADIVQAIQSVAAEPGYRFGDDKINLPRSQSRIIWRKSFRFLADVPVMPSSA